MSAFHRRADMFVAYPKVQLAFYKDNTMPKRRWSDYDEPAHIRKERALAGEIEKRKRA